MRRPHRPPDRTDLLRLRRWQHWMVSVFIGMWAYALMVIAVHVLLAPPTRITRLALLPVLGLVIYGVVLQFSIRCPACGYRLGRQTRLLVPDRCRSCGVPLRASKEWLG